MIITRFAALRSVLSTAIRPWFWRMQPRLFLVASCTASASSFDPGMNQGTSCVSRRKTASVLIGGNGSMRIGRHAIASFKPARR